MRLNVLFQEQNDTIKFNAACPVDYYNVDFGEVQTITENDYNKLENKPIINSVVLEGALTAEDLGLGRVYYDSKENWDSQRELIAEKGVVYIYSDYAFIEDESGNKTKIAGIRIGDGTSYLIDMPFISDAATYLITKQSGDSNTTSISNLYLYNGHYRADSILYRYELLFQTDENTLTPLNNVSNGYGSTTKVMLTDVEFDPFGRIYYYNATTTINPGANIGAGSLFWSLSGFDLRYTFNCGSTLTAHKPFYLVVTPTSNGKCKIADDTPWAQDLPTTNDGKWYILLGRTYSAYQMALHSEHPVFCHDGTTIRRVVPPEPFSSLSLGSAGYLADSIVYRYQLLFQMDDFKVTPLNNVSNATGTGKTMLTNVEFDPFGDIFYYATTTTVNANARVNGVYMCYAYGALDLRYTFNCGQTLTAYAPVYLKVSLQSNGKVKIADSTPWEQTLPSTNDGYYYIYLGRTYSTYQMTLEKDHPVFYHDGTNIREYIKPARRFVAILG